MAEFPALPLWTDAYIADTHHLTTLEHGAYLLLLMTMWRTKDCSLPNDDARLARFARLTPAQWRRIKPTIIEFFRVDGDVIRQGRLTDERDVVKRRSQSQSRNARARWLKDKESGDASAYAAGMPTTPTPTPTKKTPLIPPSGGSAEKRQKPKKRAARLPDDWTLPGDWAEWAVENGLPAGRVQTEGERFADYWRSKGGSTASKLDWRATWRNWVRGAVDRLPGPHRAQRGGGRSAFGTMKEN